jgi:Cu/Zn superoxide dismutase
MTRISGGFMKTLAKFVPISAFMLIASVALVGCGSSSSSGGSGGASGSGGAGSGGSSGSGGAGSGGVTGSGGAGSGGTVGTGGTVVPDGGGDTATDTVTDTAGETSDDTAAGPMAQATIVATGGGTITGTVTFVNVAGGVQVTYALENCPAGVHPTHIHVGATCGADGQAAGLHWDSPRGDNIGSGTGQITCTADMKGAMTYTRMSGDANTRWTIGAPAASNVIGHTLMIHGVLDTNQRHGCGPIVMK